MGHACANQNQQICSATHGTRYFTIINKSESVVTTLSTINIQRNKPNGVTELSKAESSGLFIGKTSTRQQFMSVASCDVTMMCSVIGASRPSTLVCNLSVGTKQSFPCCACVCVCVHACLPSCEGLYVHVLMC